MLSLSLSLLLAYVLWAAAPLCRASFRCPVYSSEGALLVRLTFSQVIRSHYIQVESSVDCLCQTAHTHTQRWKISCSLVYKLQVQQCSLVYPLADIWLLSKRGFLLVSFVKKKSKKRRNKSFRLRAGWTDGYYISCKRSFARSHAYDSCDLELQQKGHWYVALLIRPNCLPKTCEKNGCTVDSHPSPSVCDDFFRVNGP